MLTPFAEFSATMVVLKGTGNQRKNDIHNFMNHLLKIYNQKREFKFKLIDML